MGSDPPQTDDDTSQTKPPTSTTDGGAPPIFDEATLYTVVRNAIEDALLNVLGTLLLVGFAGVIVWVGGIVLLSAPSLLGTVVGALGVIGGIFLAAITLDIMPPIHDWL